MSLKIPIDFDYKSIPLDPLELKIRDELMVDVSCWSKFRHSINVGTNSSSLHSNSSIASEVKESYIELGKSHYEVVTSLGATKISLDNVIKSINKDGLLFKKSFKEFYMHAGSVLDNLARIIFIINIPCAPTLKDKNGKYKRLSIGYGSLKTIYQKNASHLKGYSNFIKSKTINEIKTIRNNFTHSWIPTIFKDRNSGSLMWPVAMRKKEQYYLWPHDIYEQKKIKRLYRKKELIESMCSRDWSELENQQNKMFDRLAKDVEKFEANHNLVIR